MFLQSAVRGGGDVIWEPMVMSLVRLCFESYDRYLTSRAGTSPTGLLAQGRLRLCPPRPSVPGKQCLNSDVLLFSYAASLAQRRGENCFWAAGTRSVTTLELVRWGRKWGRQPSEATVRILTWMGSTEVN